MATQLRPTTRCWRGRTHAFQAHPLRVMGGSRVQSQRCQAISMQESRRHVLLSMSLAGLVLCDPRPSRAEPTAEAPSAPPAPTATPTLDTNLFQDDEYTYYPPVGFDYIDIPVPKSRPGPAPERSPLRSRFEAKLPGGKSASVSVAVRNAQALSFTLMQVTDISAYGPPEQAAQLLVPKGSTLLRASSQVITLPPRETPVGTVDIPPKSYYLYEFLSPQGDHIIMSAAAARGKVFVCGGAAPKAEWATYAAKLIDCVKSFRLL